MRINLKNLFIVTVLSFSIGAAVQLLTGEILLTILSGAIVGAVTAAMGICIVE